jgi:IclR family mhp operon transcriptional activator
MQSLNRGLAVIQSVFENGPCGLHVIHEDTNLPKPTLLRILATLESRGIIFRAIDDKRYRISGNSFLFGQKRDLQIVLQEVSVPILSNLCKDIAWPTDLVVRDGHCMAVVASNRMLSPFPIKPTPHGHQPDMLLTAVGRAYLTFCGDEERDEIVASIKKATPAHPELRDPKSLPALLRQTREQGYGVRSKIKHDGFSAIAVPVMVKGTPAACINLFFYKSAVSQENVAADHLKRLTTAAQEIAAAIENCSK